MPRGPVRSKEKLLNDLAQLMADHGKSTLTTYEYVQLSKGKDLAVASTYKSKFGSWENAIRAATALTTGFLEEGATNAIADYSSGTDTNDVAVDAATPELEKLASSEASAMSDTSAQPIPKQEALQTPQSPIPAKQPTPPRAVTWKETPREIRDQELLEARQAAEKDGTSHEVRLVNLFGTKVIFGREAISAYMKSLDSEGEARICSNELAFVRDGADNANGLQRLVAGTTLRRRKLAVKILKNGTLLDFPAEKPRVYYLVSESVASILGATGRKDLIYPCAYGSGTEGAIVCHEIVIP